LIGITVLISQLRNTKEVSGLGDGAIGLARAVEIIGEMRQENAAQRKHVIVCEGIIAQLRQEVAELEAVVAEQRDIIESLREQLMPPPSDWGDSPPPCTC
jgi:predicted RNase H-like nuclease (RuvC/YqgF family)